jgi:hypothetical protein
VIRDWVTSTLAYGAEKPIDGDTAGNSITISIISSKLGDSEANWVLCGAFYSETLRLSGGKGKLKWGLCTHTHTEN